MRALLMHPAQEFDLARSLPVNEQALTRDLELETLWSAMAGGDRFLFETARRALLLSLSEPEQVRYRQQLLSDCLEHRALAPALYELAGAALEAARGVWRNVLDDSPGARLGESVEKMQLLVGSLRRLRELADEHAASIRSEGFKRFFAMLSEELDHAYFELLERQLEELELGGGVLISARLAEGGKGAAYVLRRPRERGLLDRMLDRSGYSFTIPDRDENGFRALSGLEDRGLNLAANAIAQSVDNVNGFFEALRAQAGFYVACLKLHDVLKEKGEPCCLPEPAPLSEPALTADGIYDVCLALTLDTNVVGNEVRADGKSLVMITGANQGGKSTLLRSLGLAQLMLQAGMFVGAESFRANVCTGVFTHYKREEDATMEGGKLDEELSRMSGIADEIHPGSLLLCNESFASTNEREGSEIARQVLGAMVDERVKVVFVTHMYDLAEGLYAQHRDDVLFLRAQRQTDGRRSFKLIEGQPLPTSYGEDSYERVFGRKLRSPPAARLEANR